MKRDDEALLDAAIQALQTAEPDASGIAASARRVADRLGLESVSHTAIEMIASCDDVRNLLPSYQAGTLSTNRSQLIEAHLRDCSACLHHSRKGAASTAVDWSLPARSRARTTTEGAGKYVGAPRWVLNWATAACAALLVSSFFLYRAYWQVPQGVRAEVQSVDGFAYRSTSHGDVRLSAGDSLTEGQQLRTSGGGHAVIRLSDGSVVEVNERSSLGVGAQGRDMTLSLNDGAVIVQAARRQSGHLYVNTPDCRAAVTGTVFSVNSGIKGSRVAVVQGSVEVSHAGVDSVVRAGDQFSTTQNLSPAPVTSEIAWSHDKDKYLPMLAAVAQLQKKLEAIPFPTSRYNSDLITRVPADTLLYVSIPNLGDFLADADKIFDDQLQHSAALQQWWASAHGSNTAELDALVQKLHTMSQYIGDEVVIVGIKQAGNPGVAVVTDLKKDGLKEFIQSEMPIGRSSAITFFDEASLSSASSTQTSGVYALMRPHEAVFSNSIATLKQMNAQLSSTASGFATGDFGQQITAAYQRGAGIIVAADLHSIMADKFKMKAVNKNSEKLIGDSGMDDVRYLIAEHRETNGVPENHLNLQFSGARQKVASWLAAPAPIGSLDFVTPHAAFATAFLSKDPKAIADDILSMAATDGNDKLQGLDMAEAATQVSLRNDIAANLGGDFLLSLDGPILPTPSWKAVIEIRDASQIESALERVAQASRNFGSQGSDKNFRGVQIDSSEAGGQTFYAVHSVSSGAIVAQYTFSGGYMVIGPDRALLIEALRTHHSGDSLARAASFRALLPKDQNENYSAIAYQNLSPVLGPMLSQFGGESSEAIRQLAADARPTAICAWGKDNRIEAETDSHLFGFDFLALGSLIHGNKHAD